MLLTNTKSSMNKKLFLFTVCIIILIAAFFIEWRINRKVLFSIDLTGLVLNDLNDNEVILSNFKNKPLVLNFWGTWCGPCLEELAAFENVRKNYVGRVTFIMVSDESIDKIKKFQQKNNYSFLFVRSLKSFDDLGIASVPVTSLYDANGNFVITKNEPLHKDELNQLIEAMIGSK